MNAQFPPLPRAPAPAPEHGDHHDHDKIRVPREVVFMTIGFLALCLALIIAGRATGMGITQEDVAALHPVTSFTVAGAGHIGDDPVPALIATRADGKRVVLAGEGKELFPRLIVRGLLTMRTRRGVDLGLPIRMEMGDDGQRMLVDPETGYTIRLSAFGGENGHAFDALLPAGAR
ncbi:photosynthetic complex assembly protein PuhC [Erythrobacter sp. LQ02-29]|uniref:photosynthetic complex assembly protein PuhC n=1 Tax=Erythrobacter sp. LQ02-29 TaxID=2920384 RepID=UPI001F4F07DE|nr:photosynthetic complex assembly protein PuhC [Erythrobacter sp. LQ02-29]MCP9223839.1 photosynthetic complex assembly protein PuhC [Erythrobacter sp. LQ02-29]